MSRYSKVKLPKIYRDCHYVADDIITKFCVDNRPVAVKDDGYDTEQKLPVGYNSRVFDNLNNMNVDND